MSTHLTAGFTTKMFFLLIIIRHSRQLCDHSLLAKSLSLPLLSTRNSLCLLLRMLRGLPAAFIHVSLWGCCCRVTFTLKKISVAKKAFHTVGCIIYVCSNVVCSSKSKRLQNDHFCYTNQLELLEKFPKQNYHFNKRAVDQIICIIIVTSSDS